MKITKTQLKKIIKEEVRLVNERHADMDYEVPTACVY